MNIQPQELKETSDMDLDILFFVTSWADLKASALLEPLVRRI